jgi:hypothetical protein
LEETPAEFKRCFSFLACVGDLGGKKETVWLHFTSRVPYKITRVSTELSEKRSSVITTTSFAIITYHYKCPPS